MAFLERVKDDFNKRYGGGKAATAVAKSLNKDFGYFFGPRISLQSYFPVVKNQLWMLNRLIFSFRPKLKEHMQYCVDHPEEMNKLAKVQAQISEVKGVMMENIEKVCVYFIQMMNSLCQKRG